MNISEESVVSELVANDYRTAAVFEKNGIDFCCNGNRTINAVCQEKGLTSSSLIEGLNEVIATKNEGAINYTEWPLDLLADYIEKKHHRYVERQIPVLKQYLAKISTVHGGRHPELVKINEIFNISAGEFTKHMKKEELIIFPFVKKLVNAEMSGSKIESPSFGSIENPIQMMMSDHNDEGERFREIAALSDNYSTPADGCNTYRVTFSLLKEFEDDLHTHIHLENNILFPKSIALEKKLNG